MRMVLSVSLIISGLLMTCGCSGSGVFPSELKQLYPVTIAVMEGSQPKAGVTVRLSSKGPQGAYGCSGITDAKGVVTIQTTRGSYTRNGVPSGTYSIVLVETVELPTDLVPQPSDIDLPQAARLAKEAKLDAFMKKNQSIPALLTLSDSSPLELTVENTAVTFEVDISKFR